MLCDDDIFDVRLVVAKGLSFVVVYSRYPTAPSRKLLALISFSASIPATKDFL